MKYKTTCFPCFKLYQRTFIDPKDAADFKKRTMMDCAAGDECILEAPASDTHTCPACLKNIHGCCGERNDDASLKYQTTCWPCFELYQRTFIDPKDAADFFTLLKSPPGSIVTGNETVRDITPDDLTLIGAPTLSPAFASAQATTGNTRTLPFLPTHQQHASDPAYLSALAASYHGGYAAAIPPGPGWGRHWGANDADVSAPSSRETQKRKSKKAASKQAKPKGTGRKRGAPNYTGLEMAVLVEAYMCVDPKTTNLNEWENVKKKYVQIFADDELGDDGVPPNERSAKSLLDKFNSLTSMSREDAKKKKIDHLLDRLQDREKDQGAASGMRSSNANVQRDLERRRNERARSESGIDDEAADEDNGSEEEDAAGEATRKRLLVRREEQAKVKKGKHDFTESMKSLMQDTIPKALASLSTSNPGPGNHEQIAKLAIDQRHLKSELGAVKSERV